MTDAMTTAPATRTRLPLVFMLVVLLVSGAIAAWGLIEPRVLRVSQATVTSPDLPPEFDGVRVAYFADVHAGPLFSRDRVARLVDRVNALDPDLILIGGDNVGGRLGGADRFYPEVRRLEAPLGVYGVLGNHDYWEGEATSRAEMAAAGIQVLDNENVPVTRDGAQIRLGGVADAWEGQPNLRKASKGIAPDEFALLLCHNADTLARQLPRTPGVWDLALTGHMHGGQVTLFGLWAPIVPSQYGQRYRSGWVEEEGTLILISNGVGTVTVPVRLFAPPEIHLITLRRGQRLDVEGARVRGQSAR